MAITLDDDFPWDRPLKHRMGSPKRLDGIDLYTDCSLWADLFPDGRAQFKNGKALAELVKKDCPRSKTPALLLTRRDVEQQPIETDTHYVAVVNLPEYLAQATPNAAVSYYARFLGPGITGAARLHQLAARADVIDAVVTRELNKEHIAAWALTAERLQELREIAGVDDSTRSRPHPADIAAAVQALGSLDADLVNEIAALVGREVDPAARLRLLRALTDDRSGRKAAGEVLGQRIVDRLADLRAVANEYAALLDDPDSGETALQKFIEKNPWLLGLDYVKMRPRRALPRGEMDFILERYDGFHDLLELKKPHDPIIDAPDEVDGMPPAANKYGLSDDLAQALAQVHVYRDTLTTDPEIADRLYGLQGARDPRLFIVIGQVKALRSHRARVLRELNLSLHRVEIVPYDVLADRANAVLDNVQQYLAASQQEAPEDS
jgi:Shedu protein SduA, C-terminal